MIKNHKQQQNYLILGSNMTQTKAHSKKVLRCFYTSKFGKMKEFFK